MEQLGMRPNFIVVGAHKAGTTSLYMYLKQHPEVFMPELKEPRFFAYDETNHAHQRLSRQTFPIRTLKEYDALFNTDSSCKAVGEASPEYLNSPIAAERIRELIPEAKIVVALRHPTERLYSLYQMILRSGQTDASFVDWVQANLASDEYTKQTMYYYQNLKRYFHLFEPEQIKVCLFDDLINDAIHVMQDLYRFLEVDQHFVPDTTGQFNKGGLPKNQLLHNVLSSKKFALKYRRFVPATIRNLLGNLRDQNLDKAPELEQTAKDTLAALLTEDIQNVETLIGHDLSGWWDDNAARD